ncbi:hypothetical protein CNECB9_560048 [Cupriavidus necator]|uniref:Uncharacterized protein n=2 Tax=Cupriavidus necator TaxID=106590 RepID=A0A1K0J2U1_CUPNE|nr:hypothetical protein CNECB9_560048 [Cupriavidus necator]
MGFPESCKFVGYVVHLPDSDEFVVSAREPQPGVMFYEYAVTPSLAKAYPNFRSALKIADGIQKLRTVVGYLFDHGSQWLVGFQGTEAEPQISANRRWIKLAPWPKNWRWQRPHQHVAAMQEEFGRGGRPHPANSGPQLDTISESQ